MADDTRTRRQVSDTIDQIDPGSAPPAAALSASDQRALTTALAGRPPDAGRLVSILCHGYDAEAAVAVAASVARQLRLPLYRVDLGRVASAYIGETEKHLGAVFDLAANAGAVLFLDDADALFGKRSDVKDGHDRYANQEVSYLLGRLETFAGVAVLATNSPTATDQAFTRRFTAVLRRPPRP